MRLASSWEKIGYFHGKHHIASNFKLACHKSIHRVQFAFGDSKPVFITDRKGDIRLLNSTGDYVAFIIDDLSGPYASFFPSDVPLECFVHTCCCRGIKYTRHLCEALGNCHSCSLLKPFLDAGKAPANTAIVYQYETICVQLASLHISYVPSLAL